MKLSLLAALGAALILVGCEQATTSSSNSAKTLSVTATATTTYWSLSTGAEVTDPATTSWDLAFTSSTGGVFTNGGASKQASAANGAVYYTGSTDFDSVKSYSTGGFSGTDAVDTSYYVSTAGQSGSTTAQAVLNALTKLAYVSGSGTQGDPYVNDGSAGVYQGSAYYSYTPSTNTLGVSNEVYIVRHGDGTHYSKVQITSLSGNGTSRLRVIKYLTF